MTVRRSTILVLAILTIAGCGADTSYMAEIDAWHAGRIERLRAEDGWLTLVGLHPLRDGVNTVGSSADADVRLIDKAPARVGVLEIGGGDIAFTAEPGSDVRFAGDAIETIAMRTDMEEDTTVLAVGTLNFFVIDREGLLLLRVKDAESVTRRDFAGIVRYPVDESWRVTARLVPHDPPRGVSMPNALGQTSEEPSPGVLIFELAGETCSLIPVGEPGEGLFIVFADATTGGETYGGGRFLSTEPPAADGSVVLDFNKAANPPCVFTPYATCPRPPEGNTLADSVRGGERTWGEH